MCKMYLYVYIYFKMLNFYDKNALDLHTEKVASNAVETVRMVPYVITWQAHVPKDACRDIQEINVTKVRCLVFWYEIHFFSFL